MSMSKIIKFTPKNIKIYKCDVCQQSFEWGGGSHLWGSIGHQDVGASQFKICSNECRKKAPNIADLNYIIGDYKNSYGGKVVNAHWDEWDAQIGRFLNA
jgi:hypothetical protein